MKDFCTTDTTINQKKTNKKNILIRQLQINSNLPFCSFLTMTTPVTPESQVTLNLTSLSPAGVFPPSKSQHIFLNLPRGSEKNEHEISYEKTRHKNYL